MAPDWIDAVISAGVDYLAGKTSPDHSRLWRDFELEGVSYGSTEWVSAFIAMQIGPIPEARPLALQTVLALLSYARPSGGWGYRADVPEDCDSTACVLLAAAAAGLPLAESLRQRSARLILRHQQADGGFTTYGSDAWSVIMADGRADWFASEASVTANSIMALRLAGGADGDAIDRAGAYLMAARSGGLWHSFWCKGFAYGTLQSLLALDMLGDDDGRTIVRGTRDAILAQRRASGWSIGPGAEIDAFSSAMAIRGLLALTPPASDLAPLLDALTQLKRYQTPLGSFLPSVEMLAPGGMNGLDIVLRDQGMMTTACAIRAFHDYRRWSAELP